MFSDKTRVHPPSPRAERNRSRAGILLLLYVLTAAGITRTLEGMESLPEKLGALAIPVVLLALGCWYAFKEGGRVSRICAAFLALTAVGSFGFGLIKGFDRSQASLEVNGELQRLRAGLVADAADPEFGPEAGRRHRERTREAANRMQASQHEETAALGRVIQSISDLNQESELRLLAILDVMSSERFMVFSTVLANDDFEWQRATVEEYAAAAQASMDNHRTLPEALNAQLETSGIPPAAAQGLLTGFRRTWPLSGRIYQAHAQSALAYRALIDFVELHRAGIRVEADGTLEFQEPGASEAFDELLARATHADEQVNAAVDELTRTITKG